MSLSIKILVLSIAIFQGIVTGLLIIRSSFFKNRANTYLSLALFSLSWSLLKILLEITLAIEHFPSLRLIEVIDTELLFPAFILLFAIHKVNHPLKTSKRWFWLFLPSLLSTAFFFWVYVSGINEQTLEHLSILNILLLLTLIITLIIYIPFILYKTYKIIQYSSNSKEKKWLMQLWFIEVFIFSVYSIVIFVGPLLTDQLSGALQILAMIATIVIYWISYTGIYKLKLLDEQSNLRAFLNSKHQLNKQEFINPTTTIKRTEPIASEIQKKEPKKPTKENIHYQALERLCIENKIYRDPSLDRVKVAEELGISPSYVSQLINTITGQNFSTYINNYRLEDVKSLMLNKEFNHYSLLAIGFECGFSSKTAFYKAFKDNTGMTPNAWKKANK